MIKNNRHSLIILVLTILLISIPSISFAQDLTAVTDRINTTRNQVKLIVQSIIGLAALGGGLYAYFRVQTDDGTQGKKAIGNFVLALIFGSLIIVIIEAFLG